MKLSKTAFILVSLLLGGCASVPKNAIGVLIDTTDGLIEHHNPYFTLVIQWKDRVDSGDGYWTFGEVTYVRHGRVSRGAITLRNVRVRKQDFPNALLEL